MLRARISILEWELIRQLRPILTGWGFPMLPKVGAGKKYLAVYHVAPVSAITHLAPVKSIDPWKDTGKYVINLTVSAKEIPPIPMAKSGRGQKLSESSVHKPNTSN